MTFVEPAIYYARLATSFMAAGALITDPAGRILLVKPNYRDYWLLPGGMADDGESPDAACARELREELGLGIDLGRLLVVDWAPADDERPRPTLYFLFDGGTLTDPGRIRLEHDELDAFAFFELTEATPLLSRAARRLRPALAARAAGDTVYLPTARA
jgi:8-oxo-dGTP diphosphatase